MNLVLTDEICAQVEQFRLRQRTGILVLLFTDMEGSTRLKQDLGDEKAILLTQQHHAVVRTLLRQFKEAQEIDTAGDSFFIVFVKASDAVKFSILLQSALRDLATRTKQPLRDRIGIHAGEVTMEDREGSRKPLELFGIQVDTASRVMSLAPGGQTLMSRFVFDNARQALKGSDLPGIGALSWLSHGAYAMKGVEEPLEICEVGEVGFAPLSAPPDSEKAHRHQLASSDNVLGWRPAVQQTVPNTNWVLESKLGEGGFGEVWLARHKTLKETCVFKFCFRADRVRSLKREVTLFKLLRERVGEHPNIVAIREVFFDEPPFYIIMDYAEGEDLRRWVEARGIENILLGTRVDIVIQVADALQAAHEAGIIHRDIKPSNIIICESHPGSVTVKLTDFGIGQLVDPDCLKNMTQAGGFTLDSTTSTSNTGTPLYMAPELLAGKAASIKSDIYSLGVVFFQLIVGDLGNPVTSSWEKEIESALLRDDLAKCLAGNPQDSFVAVAELARRLRRLAERRLELARQEAEAMARERAAHRHGLMRTVGAATALIALFLGLAIYASLKSGETSRMLAAHDFSEANLLIEQDDAPDAVPYLLRILQDHPRNQEALTRLATLLTYRSWPLPLLSVPFTNDIVSAAFATDGNSILVLERNNTASVWDCHGASASPPRSINSGNADFLRFSADGQKVLAVTGRKVELWPLAYGSPAPKTVVCSARVNDAEFSADGEYIVTACDNSQAQVWNAQTAEAMGPPMKHQGPVNLARFSWDCKYVATACADGTVRVWARQTAQPCTDALKHPEALTAMEFSTNSEFLLTVCFDTLHVWRLPSGSLQGIPITNANKLATAQFSPDGMRIVTTDGTDTALIWDARSGEPLAKPLKQANTINSAQFSPDATQVITASDDGTARVWDALTGKQLTEPFQHAKAVQFAQFSSTNGHILTVSRDNKVQVWAQTERPLTEPLRQAAFVTSARFSPVNNLVVTASVDGTAQLWNADTGVRVLNPLTNDQRLTLAEFDHAGQRVVTATADGRIQVWNTQTGQALGPSLNHSNRVNSIRFSSDDAQILSASDDGTAIIWDAGSGHQKVLLNVQSPVAIAAFSPDRSRVATASLHGGQLWDAQTGQPIGPPLQSGVNMRWVEFSPDGQTLVTASDNGIAQVWDARTGSATPVILRHTDKVISARFNADGRHIVTASDDYTARVWDAATGDPLTEPLKHPNKVTSAQFSPNGEQVVCTYDGGDAKVWDVKTGQPLAELSINGQPALAAEFSPDGTRILVTLADNTARVCDFAFAPSQCPEWLPPLAEALSGKCLNQQGMLQESSDNKVTTIQDVAHVLSNAGQQDSAARWGCWLLGDPTTNTISPLSTNTIHQYLVNQIDKGGGMDALAEVRRLIYAHRQLLDDLTPLTNTNVKIAAAFARNRAIKFEALGWLQKAETSYRRALTNYITLARYDEQTVIGLANVLNKEKKFSEAAEFYSEAARHNDPGALSALARFKATCPDLRFRDQPKAVKLASVAAEMTNRRQPDILDTLALTLAGMTQFDQAIATEKEAIAQARDQSRRSDYRSRLTRYEERKPYEAVPPVAKNAAASD